MSAVAAPRTFSNRTAATWLCGIAVILCAIALFGNAGIIFAILVALMLTGMPISIALGLTVLAFVFTMTKVPIQSIAL